MSNIIFKLYERNKKENVKQIRSAGFTPCVIYGEFLPEPISAKMENVELAKMLKCNSKGSIIPLTLNDKKFNCVVKEVQKSNFREILHLDLQYVKPNEVIKLRIPVNYLGQSALEAKRLVLQTFTSFVDFQGNVEKIPEFIDIDVSKMTFEDKVCAKDIHVPEGVTLITDPNTVLAVINA
ncbi:LSU ribosomal protein L25P [Clostridium collagenovorans DSM 3089]|uniref:LSU ribosomal protein L25P n=1 Tax=Clostridium collagenovorans DSM 3089 TaxID=1121306 RepID=A0A1M5VDF7_9CLOT|nr:50S ribosomal protein L25 [Clostridium collagenovorans]SHH73312.1 LSU ribosomal protein L25P [Clostridium collagenovorans DSM 3089]